MRVSRNGRSILAQGLPTKDKALDETHSPSALVLTVKLNLRQIHALGRAYDDGEVVEKNTTKAIQ